MPYAGKRTYFVRRQKMSCADSRNPFLMAKTVPPKTNNILLYRSAKQFLALDSAFGFAHSLRASHQTV
jgi:hypothetical protein